MTAPDPRPMDHQAPLPATVILRMGGHDDPDLLRIARKGEPR